MSIDRATIFAVSSGQGKAGVAVIRISGPEAGRALEALAGRLPEPRVARVRLLRTPTDLDALDRALVLWMPGPVSFTGEDVAELHIHGGRAVIAATLEALSRLSGLRPAGPGEFTRRAFANGKLDLTQVEGLADLIDAETEAQRRQAACQADGVLGRLYEAWRMSLIKLQALIESSLDFADEGDVPDDVLRSAREPARKLLCSIEAHLKDARRGEIIRDGFRVVLAGPPNAGKSSLLNALARRDVAIVSSEPGTTRDALEVRLDIGGHLVLLTDTAGLRAIASGPIEAEGMRRSQARIEDADLVLWVVDGAEPLPPPEVLPDETLVLLNKADLYGDRLPPAWLPLAALAVSAQTGQGLATLLDRIGARLGSADRSEHPALSRLRHRRDLEMAVSALRAFLDGTPDQPELRAEDLRQAAHALGRITGRVDVEDVLEAIFAAFCIGK